MSEAWELLILRHGVVNFYLVYTNGIVLYLASVCYQWLYMHQHYDKLIAFRTVATVQTAE